MSEPSWVISGVIEAVDLEGGLVTLWLNGLDHFETVPIAPNMPDWLLHPGVFFETTIPREVNKHKLSEAKNLRWGEFHYDEIGTNSTEQELIEQLDQQFYGKEE